MAKMHVSEYQTVALSANSGNIMAPQEPRLAAHEVTIAGASAQSGAFLAGTRLVRVHVDVACYIKFGSDPTAVTSEGRMAAGQTEYFGVKGGDKVAVIQE